MLAKYSHHHQHYLFLYLDLLSNRIDFDSVTVSSSGEGKTFFTAEQREALEAMFHRKKYPTRNEKASRAAKLDIGVTKVQVCLGIFAVLHITYL